MEDALVLFVVLLHKKMVLSLNPCFNGRCTSTLTSLSQAPEFAIVLILVLMEDALVPLMKYFKQYVLRLS